jgi:hypothetical protein
MSDHETRVNHSDPPLQWTRYCVRPFCMRRARIAGGVCGVCLQEDAQKIGPKYKHYASEVRRGVRKRNDFTRVDSPS